MLNITLPCTYDRSEKGKVEGWFGEREGGRGDFFLIRLSTVSMKS